ncbi:transmembrane 220 family protein [Confluentibacter citreus]|uniref:transmembrane 220 family protein n=1 Tax=Confluentibacter citreus TaxID=2007307 RepID=UPI000C2942AB|nr:transmembrane 220 family protein [Confluentibacter citreus]
MTTDQNINKSRKIINIILFILFVLFALAQLNDPDPMVWFTIYGIIASICLIANYKKISKMLLWVLIIALLVYSLTYLTYFIDWFKIDNKEELFGEMVYEKPYLEGTREFLGLLIAAGALIYQLKRPVFK